MKRQNDNSSQESVAGVYLSLAVTREVTLDTQAFDTSAVEIKEFAFLNRLIVHFLV